jgi:Ras-related protein Rab-5B
MSVTEFKIVIIGAVAVGKTALATRLQRSNFDEDYQPTIGAGYFSHRMIVDDREVELQIWDTAGMERYRSLGPIYYRDSVAAIIVYDQNDPTTADGVKTWYEAFRTTVTGNAVVVVAANKADLECKVPQEPMEGWAHDNGFDFFCTSAKTGIGVLELFTSVVSKLLELDGDSAAPRRKTDGSSGGVQSCC